MGLKTLINAIYQEREYGQKVQRAAAADPAGGAVQVLFTISGGIVLVTMLVGVRTIIQAAGASNFTFSHSVGPTNLCTATAVTGNDVDTTYTITGNFGDALQIAVDGAAAIAGITEGLLATGDRCKGILMPAGNITMTGSGAGVTGSCSYYIQFIPMDVGATIVAVP